MLLLYRCGKLSSTVNFEDAVRTKERIDNLTRSSTVSAGVAMKLHEPFQFDRIERHELRLP